MNRFSVRVHARRDLFLGVAPQPAVTNWLAGTAHDRLVTLTENTSGRYELRTTP